MTQYADLIKDILENGYYHDDRTSIGTKRLFVRTARFNLQDGFPIVTLKKTYFLGALRELLFFLKGGCKLDQMHESIRKWWMPFSDSNDGHLGAGTYGSTLRFLEDFSTNHTFDQIGNVVNEILDNPNSRRLVITSYNPLLSSLDMAENRDFGTNYLMPCHMNWCQFQVVGGKLYLAVTCRSQDVFLGTPVNWVEHALLLHIVADICNLEVGEYIWIGNDVHIYENHLTQCKELLTRKPFPLPKLKIKRKLTSIDDLQETDFELIDYQSHSVLKGDMAI